MPFKDKKSVMATVICSRNPCTSNQHCKDILGACLHRRSLGSWISTLTLTYRWTKYFLPPKPHPLDKTPRKQIPINPISQDNPPRSGIQRDTLVQRGLPKTYQLLLNLLFLAKTLNQV